LQSPQFRPVSEDKKFFTHPGAGFHSQVGPFVGRQPG
jgi:hypothetical protein